MPGKNNVSEQQLIEWGYEPDPDRPGHYRKPGAGVDTARTGKPERSAGDGPAGAVGKKAENKGRVRRTPKGKSVAVSRKVGKAPRICVSLTLCTGRRRRIWDDDNLIAALKPVRDKVAEHLGVDDSQSKILWQYAQEDTYGEEGVLVRMEHIR